MDIAKMKFPHLQSSCFGAPLSTSLLIWGYSSMVYHGLCLAVVLFLAFMALMSMSPAIDILLVLPILLCCIGVYSLLIVISSHSKKVMLVRVTFIAGTILWIFQGLYSLCLGSRIIILINQKNTPAPDGFGLCLIPVLLEPIVQGYVLLVLHSFRLKLQEEENVEFANLNRNEVESGNERCFTQIR